jgi:hypothetical protein
LFSIFIYNALHFKQANTTIPIKIKPLGFKLGLGINSKLGPYPKPRKRLLIRKKWVQLEFGVQSNGGLHRAPLFLKLVVDRFLLSISNIR